VHEAKESAHSELQLIEKLSSTNSSDDKCKDNISVAQSSSNNLSINRRFTGQPETCLRKHFSADNKLPRSVVHCSDGKLTDTRLLNLLNESDMYKKHSKVIISSSSHHCKLDQDPAKSIGNVCSDMTDGNSLSQSGFLSQRLAQFGTAETKQSDLNYTVDICNRESLISSSDNSRFVYTSTDKFSSSRETRLPLCWPNTTVSNSAVTGSISHGRLQEFVSSDIECSISRPLEHVMTLALHLPCNDAVNHFTELWELQKDRDDASDISFGDVEDDLDFNGNVSNDKVFIMILHNIKTLLNL